MRNFRHLQFAPALVFRRFSVVINWGGGSNACFYWQCADSGPVNSRVGFAVGSAASGAETPRNDCRANARNQCYHLGGRRCRCLALETSYFLVRLTTPQPSFPRRCDPARQWEEDSCNSLRAVRWRLEGLCEKAVVQEALRLDPDLSVSGVCLFAAERWLAAGPRVFFHGRQ